jgi:hypothetical protein
MRHDDSDIGQLLMRVVTITIVVLLHTRILAAHGARPQYSHLIRSFRC